MRTAIALGLILAMPAAAAGAPGEPVAATAQLEAALDAGARAQIGPSMPGGSVAVARAGKVVTRTYGTATPTTAYVIGSVTKMFTAVSVMQLVDARKLRLDDSIARWFPEYPAAKTITVRELLGHRSGIPDYLPSALTGGRVYAPTTPAQIVAEAERLPLDFTPGSKWNYSNTGYVFAAQIVEKVSGMPLARYERAHIYLPAGMHQTANATAAPGMTLAPGTFTAPAFYGKGERQNDLSWYYACGDIVSTANDLVKFDMALMRGTLLSPASFALMQRVQATQTLAPTLNDGLGLFVQKLGDRIQVGHHGGEPGYSADNEMIPSDRFAVASVVNSDTNADVLLQPVLRAFYPKNFAAMVASARAVLASAANVKPEFTARFQRVFADLLAGRVDTPDFTDAMSAALTPSTVATFAQSFSADGKLQSLIFVASQDVGRYRRYIYRVTFEHASHTEIFVLDAAGKIAGLSQGS